MLGKREEERNEKILRGLLKLPPNRNCINCNSLGPQYVCTSFWTFVCMTCSGIHREFTHRVKSVSMAKFTTQEIEALQKGGNQRAREMFLKDWDMQGMRLPSNSNVEKIREFIRDVYIRKKYAGGAASDKPPRDVQNLKNHEEDNRRPSSYHSFSQSPPYENQYEDRRYGKSQTITVTRRRGSDQGLYGGTISSAVYSPTRLREQVHEERFSNGGSGSRISDYSLPSSQSPNFQDSGRSSPTLHQLQDMIVENARSQMSNRSSSVKRDNDVIQHPQRTASSGSYASADNGSKLSKSITWEITTGTVDRTQQAAASTAASLSRSSTCRHATNQDLASVSSMQPLTGSSVPSTDLFANVSHPSSSTPLEKKQSAVSTSVNEGWATFDLPQPVASTSETSKGVSTMAPPGNGTPKGSEDALALMHGSAQWLPFENSAVPGLFTSTPDQLNLSSHGDLRSSDQKSSQSWSAFDDFSGTISHSSFVSLPGNSGLQFPVHLSSTSENSQIGFITTVDFNRSQKSAANNAVPGLGFPSPIGISIPSISTSALPPMQAEASRGPKSTNPFASYDIGLEANDSFLDMSSLQAAMPNPQIPTPFLSGLPQQWFPQNSVTQGGLAYMERQSHPQTSNLPNFPPHGSVASFGGNPFA
ncbi:putative ADP-ribosylation factor GTPase-activating protein AGD14 isoform X1 [Iris pallida]|uniref:ADP-ribosylation factor GTPase-activating protein AGD14 isoform X1 n=1 Tax=Iris pallida TaxID=29817 RepID=A0AAX6DG21_IRIPA|nr:putative ADP-ribosylation factor GTPase-activating protein AGD14 isoform X1 [Iris pallida]